MNIAQNYETGMEHSRSRVRDTLARILDVALCIAAIFIVLPALLVTAAIIRFYDNGPIFFVQRRLGRNGRSFMCWKFRTMQIDAQARLTHLLAIDGKARGEWARDQKLRVDPRVTPVGRFLRKSSIDELPQLFNVLTGDMSLVGPRPIVAAEAERYGNRYWTYCQVRPGITGIWQISGRNDVRYRRRVAMDVMFVQRFSLALYLGVLFNTVPALLFRRGAY